MEKKFLSKLTVDYIPCRLVKGTYRWYFVWYQTDPKDGIRKRSQKTFDINRISNKKERLKRSEEIRNEINEKLPSGWPYVVESKSSVYTNVVDAIIYAHKLKSDESDRIRTKQMYDSVRNVFLEFLNLYEYEKMAINAFSKKFAMDFFDYLIIDRGVGNRTYNNYLIRLKALFTALLDREVILKNPFSKIKSKKALPKKRKNILREQRVIIARFIKKNHYWLFRCLLLEYYCMIRPYEQIKMRFNYFDFKNGTINIPGDGTKNTKPRSVTIPDIIMKYFMNPEFCKYPANWFVFGYAGKPGTTRIGINYMRRHHKKIIEHLYKTNKLSDIEGLTLYSWKDSGITDVLNTKDVNPIHVQSQADHWSITETMGYYHKSVVNETFKYLKNKIDE